ncbi:Multifunctional conjugation protein TraI [Raoultella planticola]|nr:Multifunctional conjugation protein TraI [Raoultella planticola]
MNTLKESGFDIHSYREDADKRAAEINRAPVSPAKTDGPDISDVVTKAIAGLSDRKVQFTYADMLARTVSQLEAKPGVFELARTGIDAAIEREQLIPLDREKGLFTSNIHVLDELSVKALSQEVQRQNHVSVTPDASVVRHAPFSDAVSVLAQDRPAMGIVYGQGGATGQRERVAELTLMAREQGRDVHILAADNRSRDFLAGDARPGGGDGHRQVCPAGRNRVYPWRDAHCGSGREAESERDPFPARWAPCAITCRFCSPTAASVAEPEAR